MAAVMRGGTASRAKPRSKAPPPRVKSASRGAPARGDGYHPAKLHAANRVGLNPRTALIVAGGVFALGLGAAIFTGSRSETAGHIAGMGVANLMGGLGFKTKAVRVQGADATAQPDILTAAHIYRGQPILGVDLQALRQRVLQVGWVKDAKVMRLLPDTLVISVVPRDLMAVWQLQGVDRVVDNEGRIIPQADASRYPDLPLVVGDGAGEAATAILPLLRQRPPLMAQLDALVRVDNRRWDLRLKDGGIIQLPADGVDAALIQLDQLEQKARVIELGFERIDLRDPDVVAVRPKGTTPTP
ncbi:MAG TPA: cell division protein FtsQ/DivIB [Caulobacteraceae bacterium]|nr:cell division protein FtsQ/DivIB [Caulobacteraceae bacterium]